MLRQFGERYFPEGSGPTMALRACMFTNTPDEHLVIDRHPEFGQVVLASPCSGHGYKFCSVIGEILADLATGAGDTRHDIGILRLRAATQPAQPALPAARYAALERGSGWAQADVELTPCRPRRHVGMPCAFVSDAIGCLDPFP